LKKYDDKKSKNKFCEQLPKMSFLWSKTIKLRRAVLSDVRVYNIIKTGIVAILIKIGITVLNFSSVPMTAEYLGNDRFGVWLTISTVVSLLNFADFGLAVNIVNSVSRAKALNSLVTAKKDITNTFCLVGLISLLIALLYFYLSDTVYRFFFEGVVPFSLDSESRATLSTLVFFGIFTLPFGVVPRIFEGLQAGYTYQLFYLVSNIISFILLFSFIKMRFPLPYLAFSIVIPNALSSLLGLVYMCHTKWIDLLPSINLFSPNQVIHYVGNGLMFFGLQVFSFLNLGSDNFLIARFENVGNVPVFDLTKKLFSVNLLLSVFISPSWPAFAEALAKKEYVWAERYLYGMLRNTMIATSLLSLMLFAFHKQIFRVWMGREYTIPNHLLISFCLFGVVANVGGAMSSFFSANNFLKQQLFLVAIATMSTLALKIIFIKTLSSGFLVWANVLAFSVAFVGPSFWMTRRYFRSVGSETVPSHRIS
jgi:O-antigen/teichoic acid export membrane protein